MFLTATIDDTRRHYAEILRIAIPLGLANLMLVGNSVVDLLMIGHLGIQEIAGATLSIQLYVLLVVFGEGVVSALTPLFSAAMGKQKPAEQASTFFGSIALSIIISVFATTLMLLSSKVLVAAGIERELTELASSYGSVVAFSILPALFSVILWEFASIYGKASWVTISSIVGFVTNIVLNWVFISAGWGLAGVALATLLSNCVVVACILLVMTPTIRMLVRHLGPFHQVCASIPDLVRLGVPIGGIELATVGFFASSTYLMSLEASEAIAANAIAYHVTELAIVLLLGFGEAATILMAKGLGTENRSTVRRMARAITGSCLIVSAAICALIAALSPWLPTFFVTGTEHAGATVSMATTFILIGATFTILDALQIAWLGLLRGIQDTAVPMVIVMVGYWVVGVPSGYFLARPLGFGPTGIWWGLTIGLAVTCFGLGWRIVRRLSDRPLGSPPAPAI